MSREQSNVTLSNQRGTYPYRPIRYHVSDIKEISPKIALITNQSQQPAFFSILNFSKEGLRFEGNTEPLPLRIGDVIKNLQVLFNDRPFLTTIAKLKNTSINDRGNIEYGLRFLDKELDVNKIFDIRETLNQTSLGQDKRTPIGEIYRGARYGRDILDQLNIKASISIGDFSTSVTLENFSEFGFRISLPMVDLPDFLAEGKTIDALYITANDHEIFSGRIKITNAQQHQGRLEIGGSCLDIAVPIQLIFNLLKAQELKQEFHHLLSEAQSSVHVNPRFKEALNDFRFFLESMKKYFEAVEGKISALSDGDKKFFESSILSFAGEGLQEQIKNLALKVGDVVQGFSETEDLLHRNYFRAQLLEPLSESTICRRSFEKPLGYAGDYEMINIICNGRLEGNTLWQRILNHCITDFPPARAVRKRTHYLQGKIEETVSRRSPNESLVKIMCDCKAAFYLVDQEPQALDFAQRKLYTLAQQRKLLTQFICVKQSVKYLLKDPATLASYPKMDLIYVVGLYDYLPEPVAKRFTELLLTILADGGRLIIGNFSASHQFKFFIEYALDWFLIHRSHEDMYRLLPSQDRYTTASIEEVEDGVNIFLNIEK